MMRKRHTHWLLPLLFGIWLPYAGFSCTLTNTHDTQAEVIGCYFSGGVITLPTGVTINMAEAWNLTSLGPITFRIEGTGSLVFSGSGVNADELILAAGSVLIIANTANPNALVGGGQNGQQRITIGTKSYKEMEFPAIITAGGADGTSILPIELIAFRAVSTKAGIQLDWTTATELNNDYFELEYSWDGKDFEPIARIRGAGTTVVEQRYTYLHREVHAGANYYRLRQVDFDGQYSISEVINVSRKEGDGWEVILFPNPAAAVLNLQFLHPESDVLITWSDPYGRIVLTEKFIEPQNIQSYAPGHLPPGVYLLQIQASGKEVLNRRVVVQ